jgi:hypothetical protein
MYKYFKIQDSGNNNESGDKKLKIDCGNEKNLNIDLLKSHCAPAPFGT